MGKKKDREQQECRPHWLECRPHCTTDVCAESLTDWQRIEDIHRFADTLPSKYGGRAEVVANAHTFDGINYIPVAAARFLAEQATDLARDLDRVLQLAGSIYTIALQGAILPRTLPFPRKEASLPLIDGPSTTHPGPVCGLPDILACLPADEREELARYLSDPSTFRTVTAGKIFTALAERGLSFSRHTINRHRRGECVTCRLSKPTPQTSKP